MANKDEDEDENEKARQKGGWVVVFYRLGQDEDHLPSFSLLAAFAVCHRGANDVSESGKGRCSGLVTMVVVV